MPSRFYLLVAMICLSSAVVYAQPEPPPRYEVYGGYSYLSNTLNGLPGQHKALNGFDAGIAFPNWHNVRFKVDFTGYRGTNAGAPQDPYFIVGGAQYDIHPSRLRRETIFVEGLGGVGGANKTWANGNPGANTGETASFAAMAGGGLDSRITQHLAFRVNGDFQYSYFVFESKYLVPFKVAGLPTNFGHAATGLVWNF